LGFGVSVFVHDYIATMMWFKSNLFVPCGMDVYVVTIHS
jgi:hypothetical protein